MSKIIAMDYADNEAVRKFAVGNSNGDGTLYGSGQTATIGENTWYNYLNDTYISSFTNYANIFNRGLYYLGTVNGSYKLSICASINDGTTKECTKTSQTGNFYVGLPRYGEMFSTHQAGSYNNSIVMWLINRINNTNIMCIAPTAYGDSDVPDNEYGVRPTLYLSPSDVIIGGSGIYNDPYIVIGALV